MEEPLNKLEYLKLEEVSYSYQQGSFRLKGISHTFFKGEFVAITGPNGSGKTTLGKIMTGILKPDRGKVTIDGLDSKTLSLGRIGKLVGYLFQQPERQLFTPSVAEEVGFALTFMGEERESVKSRVDQILKNFSLEGLRNQSPYKLSAGEKQRLALAAVIINKPRFLILDEPTNGLDPVRKKKLAAVLKELQRDNIGLAVISHDQAFITANADRVITMAGGEIIET